MLFVPSRRVLCLALSLALTQAAIAGDDPQTSPKQERQDTVALDAVNNADSGVESRNSGKSAP